MSFQCYSLNWIITKNKQQFGPVPVLGAVQLSDLNRGATLWEKRLRRSKYRAKNRRKVLSYSNNPFSRHSSTHTLLFSLLRRRKKEKKKTSENRPVWGPSAALHFKKQRPRTVPPELKLYWHRFFGWQVPVVSVLAAVCFHCRRLSKCTTISVQNPNACKV